MVAIVGRLIRLEYTVEEEIEKEVIWQGLEIQLEKSLLPRLIWAELQPSYHLLDVVFCRRWG